MFRFLLNKYSQTVQKIKEIIIVLTECCVDHRPKEIQIFLIFSKIKISALHDI
ncbi:hypothetical protein HCUR_00310 [Holospora curviuscula]|uniref:Uncharacterized protein n=1 Tax=Holospora curviuscula TaxID=1082868 RepID=A0A2S5RDF3_9PROT|nr:hypothetical protein HCUR_00310 [Holospora curviuscula]